MAKKTVKELEKKLKASEEYYWSQVQQEKREKGKLLVDLKDLREKLRDYTELETLAGKYTELTKWGETAYVKDTTFKFEMGEKGVQASVDDEKYYPSEWGEDSSELEDLPQLEALREEVKKLLKTVETAIEKDMEFAKLKKRIEAVSDTIETLYDALPTEEQATEEDTQEKERGE